MTIKVKNITLNEGGKNTIQIFFWSFFSFIRTADGDLRIKSLYSVRIHESKDQRKLCIWTLLMQFGNKVLIAVISSLQLSTKKHIGFLLFSTFGTKVLLWKVFPLMFHLFRLELQNSQLFDNLSCF